MVLKLDGGSSPVFRVMVDSVLRFREVKQTFSLYTWTTLLILARLQILSDQSRWKTLVCGCCPCNAYSQDQIRCVGWCVD
jgi:cell division inhibitor SulA